MLSKFTNLLSFIRSEKSFVKDVSVVMSGKMIVAVIGFFITPILTRIYSPVEYGEYAVYGSISRYLVSFGCLALPSALLSIPKVWFGRILAFACQVILLFSIFYILIFFFVDEYLDNLFGTKVFTRAWPLIVLSFGLTSIIQVLASINIRLKKFEKNSLTNVVEILSTKSSSVGIGALHLVGNGLIVGEIVGKVLGLVVLLWKRGDRILLGGFAKFLGAFNNVRHFPSFIIPSQIVNISANQLIIWFIAYQYGVDNLGQFSLASGLLNIPLMMIANSFGPVVSQKLTEVKDGIVGVSFFTKMLAIVSLISLAIYSFVYILPTEFYLFFLGEEWAQLNFLIDILCWGYVAVLINQAFGDAFIIFDKTKTVLGFNLFELILFLVAFFIIHLKGMSINYCLYAYLSIKALLVFARLFYLRKIILRLV